MARAVLEDVVPVIPQPGAAVVVCMPQINDQHTQCQAADTRPMDAPFKCQTRARVRANESLEYLQELRNPNRTGNTSLDIDNAQKLLKFHEDAVKELQDLLGQLKTKAAREKMQMAISGKVASARKPKGGVDASSSSASPSPRPRTSRRGRSRSPLTRKSCSNQKEGVDPAPPSRKDKKAKKRDRQPQ